MTVFNGTAGADRITGTSVDDTIRGQAGDDTLFGLAGNDRLYGGDGHDVLNGGEGNDLLDGGLGDDKMRGGLGDDRFYVDNVVDVVIENAGEGTDTVSASINYRLRDNVENLTLLGSAVRGVGNALDNRLVGNAANNILDGLAGADVMRGGLGDDRYYVDNAHDSAIENAGEGTDTVYASINSRLRDNVENLNLLGSAVRGFGNALDNRIIGNAGNNILDGRGGADTMRGGAGNDSYYVDNPGDRAIENSGEGTDRVYSSVSYRLAANVEDLDLTGSAVRATGNSEDNRLYGNSGDNILDGLAGGDIMRGGAGNDSYYVDDHYDRVIEDAGEGRDIVFSSISYHLGSDVEDLTLIGTAANGIGNNLGNIITGNAGDNTLLGGGGNDNLYGGDGRDILNGGTGADNMTGGGGVDTYYVDNLGDVITELGGSDDSSIAMVSVDNYVLPANVDEGFVDSTTGLTLTGSSTGGNLHGNIGDDTLIGQNGNDGLNGFGGLDTLYGGAGNDTLDSDASDASDLLYGGTGDDTYRINLGTSGFVPVITEYANEGHDQVDVSFSTASSYTLTLNVEDGTMGSTAGAQLHGNAAANVLTDYQHLGALYGGDGGDILNGGALMYGEGGNDTLNAADVDSTLVGGIGDDTLRGGAGNDLIYGGFGNDVMSGGAGADTFAFQDVDEIGGVDRITGFISSDPRLDGSQDDTLSFATIDANSVGGSGNDAFTYIGTAAFSGTPGEMRADISTGTRGSTYHFYGDTNGDGVADLEVIVTVVGSTLHSDDIAW